MLLPSPAVANLEPSIAWDVDLFLDECTAFPNVTHDDQVDATSQYLEELYLIGGEAVISSPSGQVPRQRGPAQRISSKGVQLGDRQRELTRRQLGR